MDPVLVRFRNRVRRRLAFMGVLFSKVSAFLMPKRPEVRSQRMCPFCGRITPMQKACCVECGQSLNPAQAGRASSPRERVCDDCKGVSMFDGQDVPRVFQEGWHDEKQYLHLSVYSCDRCGGPVVAGSLAVRENEISKETDLKQVGAICLSCAHRQHKMTTLDMHRQFPPVQWEPQIPSEASHLATSLDEIVHPKT